MILEDTPIVAKGFEAVVCKTWVDWDTVDVTYFWFGKVVLTAPYATMLGVTEVHSVEFDLEKMEVHFFLEGEEGEIPVTKKLQLSVI